MAKKIKVSPPPPPSARQPELRRRVREVLAMAPGRRFSEALLLAAIHRLEKDDPFVERLSTLDDLRKAIEWNHNKGYIDFARNHDEDRDEWYLTERGKEKEGQA